MYLYVGIGAIGTAFSPFRDPLSCPTVQWLDGGATRRRLIRSLRSLEGAHQPVVVAFGVRMYGKNTKYSVVQNQTSLNCI